MIHYHGGPITPEVCALRAWKARHAFISHAHPAQLELAAGVCQSFALDNGAFSQWKAGRSMDVPGFYAWVTEWRTHPGFDFAVVPDVIMGSEADNDALLADWPFAAHEGAAVWHTNESIERLVRLAHSWPRVCIGSSGEYDVAKPKAFLARMREVLPAICNNSGRPICKLHGLRMLNQLLFTQLPLASADSQNVSVNIGRDDNWKGTYLPAHKEARTAVIIERIESYNSRNALDMAVVIEEMLS